MRQLTDSTILVEPVIDFEFHFTPTQANSYRWLRINEEWQDSIGCFPPLLLGCSSGCGFDKAVVTICAGSGTGVNGGSP
jgi:hypothetical protein